MSQNTPKDLESLPQSVKDVSAEGTALFGAEPAGPKSGKPNSKSGENSRQSTGRFLWAEKLGLTRAAKFILTVIGEATAVVLGISFAWLCAVNILISQRVMDISFLEKDAARLFSNAFEGKNADVGKMTLTWEAADNTVIFRAKDITVDDVTGARLNAIAGIETELALRDVVQGHLDPLRIVIDGGELSFLRDVEGNFIGGLGTPSKVGALGPIWRGERNDGDNDLEIGRIQTLDIRNAKIYIQDAASNYKAQLSRADLDVKFGAPDITFDLQSDLNVGEGAALSAPAPLQLSGHISPDLENFDVTLAGRDFNPSLHLPRLENMKFLRAVDAPLEFRVHSLAARGSGLQKLDIFLAAGEGSLLREGNKDAFKSANVEGSYNPETERIDITTLAIESTPLKLSGAAALSNIGSPAQGLFSKNTVFSAQIEMAEWDGQRFDIEPVSINNAVISGEMLREVNQIRFDEIRADFGSFTPDLTAVMTRSETGELTNVSLSGRIGGTVNKAQLLALWPKTIIVGGREWIDNSILAANMSAITLELNADEHVLSGKPLRNPDLKVTFEASGGQLRYISTMTPLTEITGRGFLLGNQLDFTIDSGKVDDVDVRNGRATIPRIYPYGGDLVLEGGGTGPVTSFMTLLDQKPFEYVTPYGVSPEDFTGDGEIQLRVTRPLRSRVTYDQVDFQISGSLNNVSAPFSIGENKLQKGAVSLYADKSGLSVKGPVNIGPWEADLAWQEIFDAGATPTRYSVNGRLSQSDLDSFGIGLREFIGGGDVILSIEAAADGIEITRADVKADLTDTDMRMGPYWDKPKGISAEMTGVMSVGNDKSFKIQDFSVQSSGLDLKGVLEIGANLRLENIDLTQAKIAGFIDSALQIKPSPQRDRFDIYMTGNYLDVSPFVDSALNQTGGPAVSFIDVPILLTASLKELALDESYIVNDANVLFAHNSFGITQARLKGLTVDGNLSVNLSTNDAQSLREFTVDIPNASRAIYGMFGLKSLTGGRVVLSADLPAVGEHGPLTGTAQIEDVMLVNAPILTTILSLASLQGLSDALGGEGLRFQNVEFPFSYNDGLLSLREARASGPGLGMTANGEIAFGRNILDIDGVLVPAYSANSLLESIPLIGEIFVGKKGEGIFALNYTVQGAFDEAQVAVNPLSALTPGFLRGIFATQRDDLPEQLRETIEEIRPEAPTP